MDLTHSAADEAFRDEARTWLEAHKPDLPMPPGDSAEGFPVHRAWERELHDGGWAVSGRRPTSGATRRSGRANLR